MSASNYDDDDLLEYGQDFNDDDDCYEDFDNEDLTITNRKRKSILMSAASSSSSSKRKSSRFQSITTPQMTTSKSRVVLKKQKDNNLSGRIDRLCEFAHVLMHCLLFKINYYNKKTHFDKFLKYNIIVYKCKSEIVCEYITNCVESMRLLLEKSYKAENEPSCFAIGLAVLKTKDENENENLLIKRFTLQVENLKVIENESSEEDDVTDEANAELDEWNFRESILKCLYSKDIKYPANFKWQIQIKTNVSKIKEMNNCEDLFKLFAWRECEKEEVTSTATKHFASSSLAFNRISIKPVKTMNSFNKEHKLKVQLFIEEPTVSTKFDENLTYDFSKSKSRKDFRKYDATLNKTLNSSNSDCNDDDIDDLNETRNQSYQITQYK